MLNKAWMEMLSKEELIDLMDVYDAYIQDANDCDSYAEGWRPVSISEFHENEYSDYVEEELNITLTTPQKVLAEKMYVIADATMTQLDARADSFNFGDDDNFLTYKLEMSDIIKDASRGVIDTVLDYVTENPDKYHLKVEL